MEKKVQGREDERSAFTVGVVVWGVDASWPRAYVYARTVSERPRNPNPNPKPVSAPWVNQTRPLLQRRLPPCSSLPRIESPSSYHDQYISFLPNRCDHLVSFPF